MDAVEGEGVAQAAVTGVVGFGLAAPGALAARGDGLVGAFVCGCVLRAEEGMVLAIGFDDVMRGEEKASSLVIDISRMTGSSRNIEKKGKKNHNKRVCRSPPCKQVPRLRPSNRGNITRDMSTHFCKTPGTPVTPMPYRCNSPDRSSPPG